MTWVDLRKFQQVFWRRLTEFFVGSKPVVDLSLGRLDVILGLGDVVLDLAGELRARAQESGVDRSSAEPGQHS